MTIADDEKPLYLGHRERLKARFMVDEGASMADYEVLELLLTMSIPRRDVKPLAKKLISRYGDLARVLNAPSHELIKYVSTNTLVLFKLVKTCGLRASSACFCDGKSSTIVFWGEFLDYVRQLMSYNEVEEFWVFLFDADLKYIDKKLLNTGTINKTMAHPREVIKAALAKKAVKVVLAHNHPSGNPKPSAADIQLTKEIEIVADAMDLEVYDHLIVTREEIFSFRNSGYIAPKDKM